MDSIEIIIVLAFAVGIVYVFYTILKDPIFLFKTFLRGLKADGNWRLKILLFPIWGPIWLIDKIFKLKLYIKEFEEASIPQKIIFSEYDKYLLIKTKDLPHIEYIINSFQNSFDPVEYKFSLNGSLVRISTLGDDSIIKIEKEIEFSSFNSLLRFIDNSAPQNTVYNVKGILLNRFDRNSSFFIFYNSAFLSKHIGKDYLNKKLYVELLNENESTEIIYYNSNMDNFKNFDFNKFENEIVKLNYKDLEIKPST